MKPDTPNLFRSRHTEHPDGFPGTDEGSHYMSQERVVAPPVRHDHPATSHGAAASVAPTAATLRQRVYDAIAGSACGLTDEEVQDATGIGPSTQRSRRVELCEAGKVVASGQTRATRSGRKAIVWKAVKA